MQIREQEKINYTHLKKICSRNGRVVFLDHIGNLKIKKDNHQTKYMFLKSIGNILLSEDGNTLILLSEFFFKIWNLKNYEEVVCVNIPNGISEFECEFSSVQKIFFVKPSYNKITFYNTVGKKLFDVVDEYIFLCNFSTDGNSFYYDNFKKINIIDVKNGKIKFSIDKKLLDVYHCSSIFLTNNNLLLCDNNEIIFFDIQQNKIIKRNRISNCDKITNLNYSEDENFITFVDNFKLKIYSKNYIFLNEIQLEKNIYFSYEIINNEIIFLDDKSCLVIFDLVFLFKKQNILNFLYGLKNKKSSNFCFDNAKLSDSKNLAPLIFSYIPY